jgi:hypothetical protein
LLEHDFGNPDGVRVMGAPPGQVAGILSKPGDQIPGHPPALLQGCGVGQRCPVPNLNRNLNPDLFNANE